jgi:nicotinamidase-related amidase
MAKPAGISLRIAVLLAAFSGSLSVSSDAAATIIDEWTSVRVPPPPAVKPVTIDKTTTALLMLDFNKQTCNMQRRPRCVASIPHVKSLLAAARAAGVPVAWSLGGGGKPADLPEELTPAAGEPIVSSGVDKFANTGLESFLKGKGVRTVIVVGAAAHGAVLYTVSTAVMKGFKVVVPVDGMSADNAYAEQYTAWHLANAPRVSSGVTLTTIEGVRF